METIENRLVRETDLMGYIATNLKFVYVSDDDYFMQQLDSSVRTQKEKLKSDDWKTYEHPVKGVDYLKYDITEFSEKLGLGFAYDKLDKEKKTRMIYWGVEPKKIQTIL